MNNKHPGQPGKEKSSALLELTLSSFYVFFTTLWRVIFFFFFVSMEGMTPSLDVDFYFGSLDGAIVCVCVCLKESLLFHSIFPKMESGWPFCLGF